MSTKGTKFKPPRALTIAGSDSGGSAGIQADLKTFTARGVFGMSAITTVTSQNTVGVAAVHHVPIEIITQQINAVWDDMGIDSLKTGLLGRPEVIETVSKILDQRQGNYQLVVDPVLVNGRGQQIVSDDSVQAYQTLLFPKAALITPNSEEIRLLTNITIASLDDMHLAGQKLVELGAKSVLLKGGDLRFDGKIVNLLFDGHTFIEFLAEPLAVQNPHGVGCTLSAAIAAELAKGHRLADAIPTALDYLYRALQGSISWQIGDGRSPVNHFVDMEAD